MHVKKKKDERCPLGVTVGSSDERVPTRSTKCLDAVELSSFTSDETAREACE